MIRFTNLKFLPCEEITRASVAKKIGVSEKEILEFKIYKKSIDARKKTNIFYDCTIDVELNSKKKFKDAKKVENIEYTFPKALPRGDRPVIIGSGPAGLFAALMLSENGHKPIVFERGEDVDKRQKSVEEFKKNRILNPESNIQFGEGGAGTFSDGKLTTGIKNPRCREVLKTFVKYGAPEEILYSSKPHIGTDILSKVVKNIRNRIIECGGEVHFESRCEGFVIEDSKISGIIVNGKKIDAKRVILATGHSARDTVRELFGKGVLMEKKPFSVGARIEHPQKMINESQYGDFSDVLPSADYKLFSHLKSGRCVYTFCMCPGGEVVAAASAEGMVVTNGMSNYARDGENANSALLVDIRPEDFEGENVLAGIEFQEKIEKRAFIVGKKTYSAPAQYVGDFLKKKASEKRNGVEPTYRPGVVFTSLDEVLPDFVCDAMREGILEFDKKLRGFASEDAILTGPETRSSSPVRILRDKETFQSNIKGIYPCGEGAGYAGGIMSAAVDGILCAEKVVTK